MSPSSDDPITQAFRRGKDCADFQSQRVTVMGLGRFGGGTGVVDYLLRQGAHVTVTDLARPDDLRSSLASIDVGALAGLHLGAHPPSDFTAADLVVVNPAVRRNNPLLRLAAESGAALTSEINLFWMNNRARTVAVTGTVGKSTTAGLIHAMLSASGSRSHLGGNIGRSLLADLDTIQPGDWVVLELSSFQLWDLSHLRIAPDVAVVTNFFPNHLDWHGGLEEYGRAKQALTLHQQPHQLYVLNADVPELPNWPGKARRVAFGRRTEGRNSPAVTIGSEGLVLSETPQTHGASGTLLRSDWSAKLPGADQDENAAAAVAAVVFGCGIDLDDCRAGLQSFEPLAHRRQVVGEWNGRQFVNDSKATTPQAAIAALKAFRDTADRILLIAGGADKGIDLQPFAREIARYSARVALLGQTAPQLAEAISRQQQGRHIETARCDSLRSALTWLMAGSRPGDTILLSPGCASFGEFLNYEQRGNCFVQLLREWTEGHQVQCTGPCSTRAGFKTCSRGL